MALCPTCNSQQANKPYQLDFISLLFLWSYTYIIFSESKPQRFLIHGTFWVSSCVICACLLSVHVYPVWVQAGINTVLIELAIFLVSGFNTECLKTLLKTLSDFKWHQNNCKIVVAMHRTQCKICFPDSDSLWNVLDGQKDWYFSSRVNAETPQWPHMAHCYAWQKWQHVMQLEDSCVLQWFPWLSILHYWSHNFWGWT